MELSHETRIEIIENKIDTIDLVLTDMVDEQEKIQKRLDALYNYMDSAGILYYKQMVNFLLDRMGEKGIIDAEQLKEQMQREIH